MTNEMIGWGLGVIGFGFLVWAWWPAKKDVVAEVLAETEKPAAPAPVETVAAAPVAAPAKKKAAPKKAATKKAPAKTAKKTAPKKAVKKGKK